MTQKKLQIILQTNLEMTMFPVAVRKIGSGEAVRVSIDPDALRKLGARRASNGPSIVVVSAVHFASGSLVGVLEPTDIVAIHEGDWDRTVLVIEDAAAGETPSGSGHPRLATDKAFLLHTQTVAPDLYPIAVEVVRLIRDAGVEGSLQAEGGGRWVNRPINSFTLKIQPRVKNIHFTLYGNPETYSAGDFLRRDQNSYSRGWVTNSEDAKTMANLVAVSHRRRTHR